MTGAADAVVKDMATTREAFLRGLPAALPGAAYRVEGASVEVGDSTRGLTIRLRDLPPRRLSGLHSLPLSF